jgi:DNA-binding HxlR family transcriptional regulator
MTLRKQKRKGCAMLPGSSVRGSTTGRPIMAALDMLGRRWTLRVVWELSQEPAGFRALQRRCDDMSSSVLNTRLRELADAQIVHEADGVYDLTRLGTHLVKAMQPLLKWSGDWAKALQG